MSVQTAKLIVNLVDKVTGPALAINKAMTKLNNANLANSRQLAIAQRQMIGAAGAAYAVAAAISSPTKAAMEFESAMSDVLKVVDFETPEQFKKLAQDIIDLSKELPIAATGIADIVAAAGQAGMAGDELLQFAEMAAKVGVAFDISADESGEALAKIKTALNLTVGETSLLADAINHLTNNMASDAPGMINFMRRVAATGEQYGFAAKDTAAIGSAMIAAGAEANVAATSFRNVGRALTMGEASTKAQTTAYEKLGLKASDVAANMQKDATGTLQDVLERIKALPREVQAATLSQLFGNEARALAPLVENLGLYKTALASVADEQTFLGSASAEYAVRADTAANKMQILKNQTRSLSIAIGNALIPAILNVVDRLQPMLVAIEAIVRANPKLISGVLILVSSLVALRVATIASRFAFFFLKGGVLSAALGVVKGAGLISSGAGLIVAGFARIRAAVAGAMMLSAVGGGGLLSGIVASLGGVATAVGAAVAGITAPIWAIAAAFVAVGLLVLKYWEPISNFFMGFASVIANAVSDAMAALGGFIFDKIIDVAAIFGIDAATVAAAVGSFKATISNAWEGIINFFKTLPAKLGNWMKDIFSIKDYSDEAEADFKSSGEKVAQMFVDAFKAVAKGILDWFTFLPKKIIEAIGKIDLSKIIKFPSLPKWMGGSGGNKADTSAGASSSIGARALGGPVTGGSAYLVGEEGPELFMPTQSGYVHDALQTARAFTSFTPKIPLAPSPANMNYAGGASLPGKAVNQNIQFGDIIVNNSVNASPQQIAMAVGDEVALRVRGSFSDGGH